MGALEGRNLPVQTREAAESIDFVHQFIDIGIRDLGKVVQPLPGNDSVFPSFFGVGFEVGAKKLPADCLGGQSGVVAFKTRPFGKVIGQLEGSRAVGGMSERGLGEWIRSCSGSL